MGRPLGSKNKTSAELKLEGKIKIKKAELKELAVKKQSLQQERTQPPKRVTRP